MALLVLRPDAPTLTPIPDGEARRGDRPGTSHAPARSTSWYAAAALVATTACTVLAGCRTESGDDTRAGRAQDEIAEDLVDTEIASLGVGCVHEALERRGLRIVASVMPLDFRDEPTSADSLWSPSIVTDAITSGDALFALDGMQQVVTKFNPRLEVVASVGRSGEGPGEYVRAMGLGKDQDGNILVADPGTGRVTVLDTHSLAPTSRKVPSLGRVVSLTMSDGVLYLGGMIVPEFIARSKSNGVALAMVAPGSDHAVPLVDLGTDVEAAAQLLRLPGPNPFRVVSSDGAILFLAPAAGTIDIFRQGAFIRRIRACLPEGLGAAYDRQRERSRGGAGSSSQRMQPVVTDAMIVGDTLFVIGPMRDRNGDLHVVKYALDGRLLGSTAARIGDRELPGNVRFWGSPYRLAAFDMQGTLLRVELEPERLP